MPHIDAAGVGRNLIVLISENDNIHIHVDGLFVYTANTSATTTAMLPCDQLIMLLHA